MDSKPKKKQGIKPGRVVRLPVPVQRIVEAERKRGETLAKTLNRLFAGPELYVLREAEIVKATLAEAKGAAIMLAVRDKKGKKQIEKPVKVRVIE